MKFIRGDIFAEQELLQGAVQFAIRHPEIAFGRLLSHQPFINEAFKHHAPRLGHALGLLIRRRLRPHLIKIGFGQFVDL